MSTNMRAIALVTSFNPDHLLKALPPNTINILYDFREEVFNI